MKIVDILLTIITTCLLVVTQVAAKLWLEKHTIQIFPLKQLNLAPFLSLEVLIAGASFLTGVVLWMGLLKRLEFSVLYPLVSISYIFGLIAAKVIFYEQIPPIRWFGVGLIILGVFFISRS